MKRRANHRAVSSPIRFAAPLLRPAGRVGSEGWLFLLLPKAASARLHSRGMVSIEGTINAAPFQATLNPDGDGGHWLKVDRQMRQAANAAPGDIVSLDFAPMATEPEPKVPPDLRKALSAATPQARDAWSDITPAARRDFIHWITSPKRPETRAKRIATACDLLAKGKRRPCCFDSSGRFDKSLSCPIADATPLGKMD